MTQTVQRRSAVILATVLTGLYVLWSRTIGAVVGACDDFLEIWDEVRSSW